MEMHVHAGTRHVSRPSSPTKQTIITLPRIPEVTPGPNAFAQAAARMEKHRLQGNAFYQQEAQKRKDTSPNVQHPALRQRSNSDPPSPPPSRGSCETTMSPFINAGRENSPPLKLLPEGSTQAYPTTRGFIEEYREQMLHDASGSEEERTPVFVSTPKVCQAGFANGSATAKKRATPEGSLADQTKSPRKGLLEKLRFTNSRPNSTTPLGSTTRPEESVPLKPQAMPGTSPRSNVSRSPSKKKKLFSRKSDAAEPNASKNILFRQSALNEEPPQTAIPSVKTQQTAWSDPMHTSCDGKRGLSNQLMEQLAKQEPEANRIHITRSQSLRYMDERVPPTPPAKNTPPHEKDARQNRPVGRRPTFSKQTPSKDPSYRVDLTGRMSPTKVGTYGYKAMPTLVEKPSIYSMHASVFPNLNDATTYEEMKARVEGLGLEGLSAIPDRFAYSNPKVTYSPSIYSDEWGTRSSTLIASPPMGHDSKHIKSPSMPSIPEYRHTDSFHTKNSSSSGGTIHVKYPELASDPSYHDLHQLQNQPRTPLDEHSSKLGGYGELEGTLPFHGHTHSRDHSNSPHHSTISNRNSADVSIFALPGTADPSFSPDSHHPSAMPSPLHTSLETLPATFYTPPPPKTKRECGRSAVAVQHSFVTGSDNGADAMTLRVLEGSEGAPPDPQYKPNKLFANVPDFSTAAGSQLDGAGSPDQAANNIFLDKNVDVDPQKAWKEPTEPTEPSKLDRMLEILMQMNLQNSALRDEFKASSARLDERLSAVELVRFSDPLSSCDQTGRSEEGRGVYYTNERTEMDPHNGGYSIRGLSNFKTNGNPTIASSDRELLDATAGTQLVSMLEGFAQRLESLEKRISGDGERRGDRAGKQRLEGQWESEALEGLLDLRGPALGDLVLNGGSVCSG